MANGNQNNNQNQNQGDDLGFARWPIGSAPWLQQFYWQQVGDINRQEQLARQAGRLQLNIPEYDVQQQDRFLRMFQGAGRREGETAARGVYSALAGRGGGGIGSSLALGAQARTSPSLQALSAGAGYDFQAYQQDLQDYMARLGIEQARFGAQMGAIQAERAGLQNALAQRFNILNQVVGASLGQLASATQLSVAQTAADAEVQAAIWGAVGQGLGASPAGGIGGGLLGVASAMGVTG